MAISEEEMRRKLMTDAFRMPSAATMVSRKSSITNAFVSSVIPIIPPTHDEIEEALRILGQDPKNVRCAYCGDQATEWDHLRPLVVKRRPTGYVSEIANLVPACGKCNQSKGNKNWLEWMRSSASLSPTGRGVAGVAERVTYLEKFEAWKCPTVVNFSAIIGNDEWERYWSLCDEVNEDLRKAQEVAEFLRLRVLKTIGKI